MAITLVLSTQVSAASISSSLNSTRTNVKTTFSCGETGAFHVVVKGYEKHTTTNDYYYYNKSKNVSGGGTLLTSHTTDLGYKFLKKYNSKVLSSYVYFNTSTLIGYVVTD